mgnify:CR=1 FL=1
MASTNPAASERGSRPLPAAPGTLAWLAFAAVCFFWGTTANAIRVGVQHIPPVFMSGARFFVAGLLATTLLVSFGRRLPRGRRQWSFVLAGGLGLAAANGTLNVGFTQVPSGLGSLLVSSNGLWIALIEAAWPGGRAPRAAAWAGLVAGFLGVAVLMVGKGISGADPFHLALMIASALFWAVAIVYQHRRSRVEEVPDAMMAAALQMLIATPPLLVVSAALGERPVWPVPADSTLAFVWLVLFGSLVGYMAYQYSISKLSVSVLGLVPLINPVVAVLIGWWLLGESLSGRFWLAAALVLAGVALVRWSESHPPAEGERDVPPSLDGVAQPAEGDQ